jgi:hypothetical protein
MLISKRQISPRVKRCLPFAIPVNIRTIRLNAIEERLEQNSRSVRNRLSAASKLLPESS